MSCCFAHSNFIGIYAYTLSGPVFRFIISIPIFFLHKRSNTHAHAVYAVLILLCVVCIHFHDRTHIEYSKWSETKKKHNKQSTEWMKESLSQTEIAYSRISSFDMKSKQNLFYAYPHTMDVCVYVSVIFTHRLHKISRVFSNNWSVLTWNSASCCHCHLNTLCVRHIYVQLFFLSSSFSSSLLTHSLIVYITSTQSSSKSSNKHWCRTSRRRT